MTAPKVSVVDYGIGNLYSVTRALEHCGARVSLVSNASEVLEADRLLLPGVGAFADGMNGLRSRGLIEAIQRFAATGRHLLGICLGMQMLASVSEEFGEHDGLALIPGRVVAVPGKTVQGAPQKIPHVGWSKLMPPSRQRWNDSILAATPAGAEMYLVHSFHFVPDDPSHVLAVCDYGGHAVTAAVQRGSISGCQFHPEKSGNAGLQLLSRFVSM